MPEDGAWRTLLASEHSRDVVLAVDFDVTGRPEARFTDLVARLKTDVNIWESVPLDGSSAACEAADYVRHWMRRIEAERPPVRAIMGFCAGSVYAAELADRIGRWQDPEPLLVLFDPELIVRQSLLWQFQKIIGYLAPFVSDEQVAAARAKGQLLHDEAGDVAVLRTAFIGLMREVCEPVFAGAGLDAKRREEFFGMFSSFLSYLAAASELDPVTRWGSAVAYSSSTPFSGLRGVRAAGLHDGLLVGREIEIETEHARMLADERLAVEVSDLLNATR